MAEASRQIGVTEQTLYRWRPWENGYIESFNARMRNELLDGEIFYTLEEVRVISGWWREHLPRWPIGSAALRRSPTLAAEPAMN